MSISVTNHIIQRYRERVKRFLSSYDIVHTLKEIYQQAETIATYNIERNSIPETIIIKAKDNFIIISCLKRKSKINLVTCFYEDNLRRFEKMDSGFRELLYS